MSKKIWWIITALLFGLTIYYVFLNGNFDETPFATHRYGTGVVRPTSPYRVKVWVCFFASCVTCCLAINAKPEEKTSRKKIHMPAERVVGIVLTGFIVFLYVLYYFIIPVENRGVLPSPLLSISVAGLGIFLIVKSFKKKGSDNKKTTEARQPQKPTTATRKQFQSTNRSEDEEPLDEVWE